VKKSVPASSAKWVRMKTDHGVVRLRSGCGWQTVPSQNIANRLIRNHIPEIGHGARDPVVAPVPVLARYANDQLLHLALEPRSAGTLTTLRAREFTGDQLAVPGQDRGRPGDGCDLGENLATQARLISPSVARLGVRESAYQLVFQDAVFGGQIFVSGQELLSTVLVT
jgi:hypothetical protein